MQMLGAVLLVSVTVLVLVAVALYPREPELSANLCPPSGPTGQVILVIDATDPLTFTQRKAVAQLVDQMSDPGRTPQGTLLSVFVFGADVASSADPLFERCSPGSGAGKNELTHNLKLWQQRFREEFERPLRAKVPQMEASAPAARSPIIQMLQIAALRYQKSNTSGERRLILVSDMLQNTPEMSLYREAMDYEQYRRRPEAQRLRADLQGVIVETHLLMNSPQIQNRRFLKFWEDYFTDMGARLVEVRTLPG
jgi:hypothetical protein